MKQQTNRGDYFREYYRKNRAKVLARGKQWRREHPKYITNRNRKAKIDALTHYGNGECSCVICGEDRLDCLSIDHIDNDRTERTQSLGKHRYFGGSTFYIWARKRNYPMGYQTLCMNCQFIKRMEALRQIEAPDNEQIQMQLWEGGVCRGHR